MGEEGGGSAVKKFIAAVLILLVLGGAVVAVVFPELWQGWLESAKRPQGNRVLCRELGISIEIPEGWTSEIRSVGTPSLWAKNPPGDSVSVTFRRVPAGTDLETFAREQLSLGAGDIYTEHESAAAALGGVSGWKLVASCRRKSDKVPTDSLFYVLPRGERMYAVHCTTGLLRFEEQREVLEGIAESLRFEAPAKE